MRVRRRADAQTRKAWVRLMRTRTRPRLHQSKAEGLAGREGRWKMPEGWMEVKHKREEYGVKGRYGEELRMKRRADAQTRAERAGLVRMRTRSLPRHLKRAPRDGER